MKGGTVFKCKVCGKEFEDWHAVGGHMRMHTAKGEIVGKERKVKAESASEENLAKALGKLSEISAQEAWQIVVGWIMDTYKEAQMRERIIQGYRIRVEEGEEKIATVQRDLKRMQDMIAGKQIYKERANQI